MRVGKKSRQLPARGGLNDLQIGRRTIADYAKATPIRSERKLPSIVEISKKAR